MDTVQANNFYFSYSTQQLRRVHTITDRFSSANTYLIDEKRLIVVDPGPRLNARLTLDYIKYILHRSPADIDLIVVTHFYPDCLGGVEALCSDSSAPIAAYPAMDAERRIRGEMQSFPHFDMFPALYARQMETVTIWLKDTVTLPAHSDWCVIVNHLHVPGSICLYNPISKELLSGDMLMTVMRHGPAGRMGLRQYQQAETSAILRDLDIHYVYPARGRPVLSMHPLRDIPVSEDW